MTLDLAELVSSTPEPELPILYGELAKAQALVLARLMSPPQNGQPQQEPPGALITPEDAATIAGLPMDTPEDRKRSVRRIYSWAAGTGIRWASRPSRKCLRISEPGFRRWLEARR